MEYEIHVTIRTNDINSFVSDCKEIKVKPIVIETEKNGCYNNQVMTSSKHTGNGFDYLITLDSICNKLKRKGYEIIRKKVEIKPLTIKNKTHIYYESHFRLRLNKNFNRSGLKNQCKELNFHFSKNLFKKDNFWDYQMITYRNNNISFSKFNEIIEEMKKRLVELNINFDKVGIEECIFDSNVKVDSGWI